MHKRYFIIEGLMCSDWNKSHKFSWSNYYCITSGKYPSRDDVMELFKCPTYYFGYRS